VTVKNFLQGGQQLRRHYRSDNPKLLHVSVSPDNRYLHERPLGKTKAEFAHAIRKVQRLLLI